MSGKAMRHLNVQIITVTACILAFVSISAFGKKLSVSVGWTKPPYVIEKMNSGFELELVKAVYKRMGHHLEFVYVPFGRSNKLINAGKVDAALTMTQKMDVKGLHLSDPYIVYQNAAISLKGRGIDLQSIEALRHHSIVGFQNASIVLGRNYKLAVEQSPLYLELPDQRTQVEMLLKGKVDVVVMDINIFNYLSREFIGRSHMDNVDIHRLFPSSPYKMAFSDPKLRDIFNKQLVDFKKSEEFQDLIKEYEFIQ